MESLMAALKVLGFTGSLRKGSYNAAALREAAELAPAGVSVEIFDRIGEFPLYNEDVKAQGFPPVVQEFREKIRAADALLIVTPEYNYSMSGVLKNAIDWASRPPDQPFNDKCVAIMSASQGVFGGARAQYHLRQSLVFLNAYFVNKPEVMIGTAQQKFDAAGKLTDDPTKDFIRQLLQGLVELTSRLKKPA
jgi:chromate reductase